MWNQMGFPSPGTEMACRLFCYHDTVMVVVITVLVGVGYFLSLFLFTSLFMKGSLNRTIKKNEGLEIVWTVTPFFFLCWIGAISLVNLYEMEVGDYVTFTLSVIGHQWYWEYHYILDTNLYIKSPDDIYSSGLKQHFNGMMLAIEKYKQVEAGSPSEMMKSLMSSYPGSFKSAYFFHLLENMAEVHKMYFNTAMEHAFKTMKAGEGLYMMQKTVEAVLEDFRKIGDRLMELCFNGVVSKWLKSNYETEPMVSESGKKVPGPWEAGLWELFVKGDWTLRYDSYIVPESDFSAGGDLYSYGGFRQQEVTDPAFLCCGVKNEVLVSSADVIHSWGVSELGVKVDAIPGRVSAVSVEPSFPGVFYGFCYELCGPNHSEMPICVIVLLYESLVEKMKWMISHSDELKELLNSSVSSMTESTSEDLMDQPPVYDPGSFPKDSMKEYLSFGMVFSTEFPDVEFFNLVSKGVSSPKVLPELKGLALECLTMEDSSNLLSKVTRYVNGLNEAEISLKGGQEFSNKISEISKSHLEKINQS
uniref:cytochrome c oxidase subunit II n=1 Tax=Cryptonema producta TaxID=870231 RepID=UPI002238EF88|nr:cytochrome c oxidase subunit II [Cryptonema producta]UYR95079.1 cytochrome c oxidase subunit II [Cryptonema producta]